MTKTVLSVFLVFALMSCGDKKDQDTASATGYAYTIAHPDQWEWGSKENIKTALNSLKAYENGNISEALKNYADTVTLQVDGFEGRISKDSMTTLFIEDRSAVKEMKIIMEDFESVKAKDGKSEYVSLWYKQIWKDQDGVIDSIECMDDLAFKNGKIHLFNEKVRRFPK